MDRELDLDLYLSKPKCRFQSKSRPIPHQSKNIMIMQIYFKTEDSTILIQAA